MLNKGNSDKLHCSNQKVMLEMFRVLLKTKKCRFPGPKVTLVEKLSLMLEHNSIATQILQMRAVLTCTVETNLRDLCSVLRMLLMLSKEKIAIKTIMLTLEKISNKTHSKNQLCLQTHMSFLKTWSEAKMFLMDS